MKLGDVSLLAGLATGKGMLGKAMRQGFGGMIPQAIAKGMYEDDEEAKRQAAISAAMPGATGMKKGGKVRGWGKARSARAAKVY